MSCWRWTARPVGAHASCSAVWRRSSRRAKPAGSRRRSSAPRSAWASARRAPGDGTLARSTASNCGAPVRSCSQSRGSAVSSATTEATSDTSIEWSWLRKAPSWRAVPNWRQAGEKGAARQQRIRQHADLLVDEGRSWHGDAYPGADDLQQVPLPADAAPFRYPHDHLAATEGRVLEPPPELDQLQPLQLRRVRPHSPDGPFGRSERHAHHTPTRRGAASSAARASRLLLVSASGPRPRGRGGGRQSWDHPFFAAECGQLLRCSSIAIMS